jgi:hypothetical protein
VWVSAPPLPLLLLPQVYLTLLCQWVGYWLLAVYLSNVLPNEVRGQYCSTTAALQRHYSGTTACTADWVAGSDQYCVGVLGDITWALGLIDPHSFRSGCVLHSRAKCSSVSCMRSIPPQDPRSRHSAVSPTTFGPRSVALLSSPSPSCVLVTPPPPFPPLP